MSQTHDQMAVLLNSPSYAEYCQTHPTEGRVLASMMSMRNQLSIAHKNLSQVLRGSQDFSACPLFMTMVDFECQIDQLTHIIDEVIKDTSQQLLFTNWGISEDLAVIQCDLALHNTLNPHHQISIA